MCRLLAIVSQDPMPFVTCVRSSSLASVSHQHPDAWGAAVLDDAGVWSVQKRARGPFQSGRWVFAHNGRVEDSAFLRSRTSPVRQRACEGATDSALLFAFLLTRLDERGCTDEHATDTTDATIMAAACELARAGLLSFVLTDGATLYVNRVGRPLYFLDRPRSNGMPAAHLFASEPISEEGWTPLWGRTLLRCHRGERLETTFLAGWDPRTVPTSDVELPFTD